MYYNAVMSASFESEKNRKAFLYTLAIMVSLLLFTILWKWTTILPPIPVAQDLIEINLGNNAEGFGEVQPLIKGEKSPGDAPAEQLKPTPVASSADNTQAEDVKPDDSKDEDAASVIKPTKPTPNSNILPKQVVTQTVKTPTVTPILAPPAPKPQRPKIAGYSGPKGGTGNGATETNGYVYQGNKPGGKGDAGSPNGKPDSYGNNPGGRNSGGASVVKGVRPLNLGLLKFEDDFNENAKVYLDVQYSSDGHFVSAVVARGTTTSNSTILSIARRKVSELKFPPGEDGVSTIFLNFKVQN